ncbi:hypothetical protein WI372_10835 [Gemmatimonadota bacterium DH-20]|uniref:6-bladed beta-propeller n=1 Tax=Gaopeijia maritima TaxID=3119007 RepID=A0ABU9EBF1_9BACT
MALDLCDCEISVQPFVTLGEVDGPAGLEAEDHGVKVDSRGRLIVWAPLADHFRVFGPSGALEGVVGRGGQGPGEYVNIMGILVGPADSLYVFDIGQSRLSVIDPGLEFARSASLSQLTVGAGFYADDHFVVNERYLTPESVGMPLHVLDLEGNVLWSFGSTISGAYRPDLREALSNRRISAGNPGRLWAARQNSYTIEHWTHSGELLSILKRDVEWFPEWMKAQSSADAPPVSAVQALQVRGDTAWVLLKRAGPNWRKAVEASGRLYRVTDPEEYRKSVVEVIDLNSRRVIASAELGMNVISFAGPGLVYRTMLGRGGVPYVVLEHLELVVNH